MNLNGSRALSENIADIGAVELAYRTYQKAAKIAAQEPHLAWPGPVHTATAVLDGCGSVLVWKTI